MREKYTLNGRIAEDTQTVFEGPLDLSLDEHMLSVRRQGGRGRRLHVAPFHGRMFFGPNHADGCEILEKGYQLSFAGSMIGTYEEGGGPDGDFDIYRIKAVEIGGAYSHAGLTVSIFASTLRGFAICYSAQERRDGIYEPIEVMVEFLVPPHALPEFLMLRVPLDDEAFARFDWPRPQA